MDLHAELREAIEHANLIDVEQALARIRRPPGERLALALYEVVVSMDQSVGEPAAELLAEIRGGRGMPFLVEALARGVRNPNALIELLEFEHLGTGWGRIGHALEVLATRSRRRLVERLLEQPEHVPPRRWRDIFANVDEASGLDSLLACFERLEAEVLTQRSLNKRSDLQEAAATAAATAADAAPLDRGQLLATVHRAMAGAILERLSEIEDPEPVQQEMARLLVAAIHVLPFVGRRLMKLVGTERVCARSRAITRALRDVRGVLARQRLDAAVPAFVALADCQDEELREFSLDRLDQLPTLGTAEDWYPLLTMGSPRARALALNAFERHPGDVSWALGRLLRSADVSLRCAAAETISHRLMRGQMVGIAALQGFVRTIARDREPDIAAHLDVTTLLRHTSPAARFFAVVELLRTPHTALVARLFDALDEEVIRALPTGGPRDLLVAALVDALINQCAADPPDEALIARIAGLLLRQPQRLVVADLDRVLVLLPVALVERLVDALEDLTDEDWLEARSMFLRVRRGLLDASKLRKVRDPRRAWALLAGLDGPDPHSRLEALKAFQTNGNPALVGHVLAMLGSAPPVHWIPDGAELPLVSVATDDEVIDRAIRAMLRVPNPDALRLAALHASAGEDAAHHTRFEQLRHDLEQLEVRPFDWPAGELPDDGVCRVRLTDRYTALRRPHRGVLGRLFAVREHDGWEHGQVTLSEQSWWQRDRDRDEVVLWEDLSLELSREPLPATLGWDVLALTVRQFEHFGTIECGVKLWVRTSPQTARLPTASQATSRHPFVRLDQTRHFLAWLRQRLEDAGARRALEVLAMMGENGVAAGAGA